MKNDHIIGLLEQAPYSSLSEQELKTVRAHMARCANCQQAYEAARVAELLLKARAAEPIEPAPFFQTRLLATLRERQLLNGVSPFQRMWRAVNLLVTSMLLLVGVLAVLTYSDAGPQPLAPNSAGPLELVEQALIAQDAQPDEEMSYGQVLTALYEPEDEAPESNLLKDDLEKRNEPRQ